MSTLADAELKVRVLRLFGEQSTMTLATTDGSNAWAAPVYFVNISFHLYFFSDPSSRHILESQSSRQASAAVFAQASTWQEIRGVQMSGTVQPIFRKLEASKTIAAYMRKFSFVHELFQTNQTPNLKTFFSRFKVRFYRFTPDTVYYLDNRVSFGFRAEVPVSK